MPIIEQPGFLFLAHYHHGKLELGLGGRGMRKGEKHLLGESEEPVLGFIGWLGRP